MKKIYCVECKKECSGEFPIKMPDGHKCNACCFGSSVNKIDEFKERLLGLIQRGECPEQLASAIVYFQCSDGARMDLIGFAIVEYHKERA